MTVIGRLLDWLMRKAVYAHSFNCKKKEKLAREMTDIELAIADASR